MRTIFHTLVILLLSGSIVFYTGCSGGKKCQTCSGVGRTGECATCRGSGKILDTYVRSDGTTDMRIASKEDIAKGNVDGIAKKFRMKHCEVCSGTGTRLCGDCNGRGTLP